MIATQNPIEQEGTYPLPEAQLDRFMFNIKVDYPTAEEEERILAATTRQEKPEVRKVLSARAILNLQKLVGSVAVSEYIIKYVAALVRATRPKDDTAPKFVRELVDWGAGPRAGQFLIHGGKALAAMDGRFAVAIDDMQKVAVPVLRHRVSTNFQAQAEGMSNEDVIVAAAEGDPDAGDSEVRRVSEPAGSGHAGTVRYFCGKAITSSMVAAPQASMARRSKPEGTAGARRQAGIGHRGEQPFGQGQGRAAVGDACDVDRFQAAAQCGRVGQLVVAVGQLDAAPVEFESLGDFDAVGAGDRRGQSRLRRRIVDENFWRRGAELRLDARCQQQIQPLVAVVAAHDASADVTPKPRRGGGEFVARCRDADRRRVLLEGVGVGRAHGRRRRRRRAGTARRAAARLPPCRRPRGTTRRS